ncbi:MAG: hypothetical protein QOJ97_61 [Solirubrobacteraceae bacterium]|jgi:hypothetical protein|nr:hypothetical protein [Solirubrobacteraceae bacterium]
MTLCAAVLAVAALLVLAAPAGAIIQSPNVKLKTKLPEAAGAIGARFSGDGRTMYVTAASGLHIYDVSNPESPQRKAVLPLPHFENEDVDVDTQRKLVIITNDPSFTQFGVLYVIDVSDPSAPRVRSATPTRIPGAAVRQATGQTGTGNGHIANCVQGCNYLWTTGTAEGITVYDLHDPDHPTMLGAFTPPAPKARAGVASTPQNPIKPGFTHDVFVDRSGIAWITGQDGTFGYRIDGDPLHPQLVYRSDEDVTNSGNSGPKSPETANSYPLDFLHHNSIRTSIQLAPRSGSTTGAAPVQAAPAPAGSAPPTAPRRRTAALKGCARFRTARLRSRCLRAAARARASCRRKRPARARALCLRSVDRRYGRAPARKRARPVAMSPRTTQGGLGDILAVTEEDYDRPTCNGQGSLQTWQITGDRNSDGSTKLKLLDLWTTELNGLSTASGRSPATTNCSAHWFDEDRGLLAQGWYDQGVRFLDVSNPRKIRQVGYYATTGQFWAAYFAPSDPTRQTVYALDTAGGIDVLHIDRTGAMPTRQVPAAAVESQMRDRSRVSVASPKWGFACLVPPGVEKS